MTVWINLPDLPADAFQDAHGSMTAVMGGIVQWTLSLLTAKGHLHGNAAQRASHARAALAALGGTLLEEPQAETVGGLLGASKLLFMEACPGDASTPRVV